MIHKIYANKASFKSIELKSGLNLIIAEKSDKSSVKDTRNGVGKTTLINIIHFCLGSGFKKSGLNIKELKDWAFTLEFDLGANIIKATRYIADEKKVFLEGEFTGWPIQPKKNEQKHFLDVENWKKLLGLLFFELPLNTGKYEPSFRTLIPYFIRKGLDSYIDPFKYFRSQKTWNWQASNAFLLGLNYKYISELQELREKGDYIKALEGSLKSGMTKSIGELQVERIRLEELVKKENDDISKYKIHPNYQKIQSDADKITRQIHELTNKNIIDIRKLNRYQESVAIENPPNQLDLEEMYKEVGIIFPMAIKRSLEEANTFHEMILYNRRLFLEAEINEIKNIVDKRDSLIIELGESRDKVMSVLKTHGALEEFSKIQELHLLNKQRLQEIKKNLSEISDMKKNKQEIKLKKIELEKKILRDYEQHKIYWEYAVKKFNENSKALYDEPGDLIINVTEDGYKFNIVIQRSNSEGVGKMKIFCYDLTLLQKFSDKKGLINFLVHDSTIFDGVDSRQRALAFEYINNISKNKNIQYICTLNSDMVPFGDFSNDFIFEDYVRLRLNDKDPRDSLLGFRFDN